MIVLYALKGTHTLSQEINGPQARHLQLISCLHFLVEGKDGYQVRHLQLASCFHSLKRDMWVPGCIFTKILLGVFSPKWEQQLKQSAEPGFVSCGHLKTRSWQEQRRAKPRLSKGLGGQILPFFEARETLHMCRKSPWESKRKGHHLTIYDTYM